MSTDLSAAVLRKIKYNCLMKKDHNPPKLRDRAVRHTSLRPGFKHTTSTTPVGEMSPTSSTPSSSSAEREAVPTKRRVLRSRLRHEVRQIGSNRAAICVPMRQRRHPTNQGAGSPIQHSKHSSQASRHAKAPTSAPAGHLSIQRPQRRSGRCYSCVHHLKTAPHQEPGLGGRPRSPDA